MGEATHKSSCLWQEWQEGKIEQKKKKGLLRKIKEGQGQREWSGPAWPERRQQADDGKEKKRGEDRKGELRGACVRHGGVEQRRENR